MFYFGIKPDDKVGHHFYDNTFECEIYRTPQMISAVSWSRWGSTEGFALTVRKSREGQQ